MIYKDKQLRFRLYNQHQERLVNMIFDRRRSFSRKGLLEKAATIKESEYSPLGNELKKQIAISKTREKKNNIKD